ncbi:MAG: DUF1194 domain-containing protein [Verrucomicrobiota bacterium]
MKPNRFRPFSKNTTLSVLGTAALGIALAFSPTEAQAIAVDSELVLLVDIVQPEMTNGMFNQLKNSYASTFTSSQFLNAIQSGVTGRIAVSVIFYGGAATQVTAVPWMSIANLSDAQSFVSLLQSANRPNTNAYSNPATALTAATSSFGTETGGSSNGFESAAQIINVTSSGIPSNSMAAATSASSANALASGVDLINAVAYGSYANSINSFYAANVIGSTLPGVTATSSIAANNGALPTSISAALTSSAQNGAAASITAVPEPSSLMSLLPAALLIFRRRR